MDEEEKVKITLSTNEIKVDKVTEQEEIYDQDIGKEIRVEDLEIKYSPTTDINEVIPEKTEDVSKEIEEVPVEEEVETGEAEESSEEEINDEPEEKEELLEESEKTEVEEEIVEKTKDISEDDKELKSDKKIIKISLIIAVVLGIIALILFLTRNKEEKNVPVIKLIGDEVVVLELDEKYEEPGYFAVDSEDGDLTNKVVIIGEVDTSKPGIYDLKYKVLDSERNRTEIYRHVIVESKTTNITFNLKGKNIVSISTNADYIEEGYEASINGENIGNKVKVYGEIDRSKVGNYPVYYVLEHNGEVVVLKRFIIVYKGEEMKTDATLITDLNNWLIDEIHYSNKIDLKNVSPSVLLYFGALNCRNDSKSVPHQEMVSCLQKLLNLKDININASTKYEGKNASISYNSGTDSWDIKRLDLPIPKDNLFEIIVENNNIYLYELYGYGVSIGEKTCDGNDYKIYYSGVDLKNIIGYESCNNGTVNQNYKLVPYVHTFRVLNGKYYWVSSDILK